MSLDPLATRLLAVMAADTTGFVDLVRKSGLKPAHDFKYADLSRADLRGQDLRAFDLSHAVLTGAQVQGALFNDTVGREQLRKANLGVPVVLITIGEHPLSMYEEMTGRLGNRVWIPNPISLALRELAADPVRRVHQTGQYVHDSTDLVRKRLSHHFKAISPTLRASGACLILIEPGNDVDLDALNVVQGYLRRDSVKYCTIVLGDMIEREDSISQIVNARRSELRGDQWLIVRSASSRSIPFYDNSTELLSRVVKARETALGFIWAVANSVPAHRLSGFTGFTYSNGQPLMVAGTRRGRETVAEAVGREVENSLEKVVFSRERLHIFVREDLYSMEISSKIASALGGRRSQCEFSVFPVRSGFTPEYYVVVGPTKSDLWDAIRAKAQDRKRVERRT